MLTLTVTELSSALPLKTYVRTYAAISLTQWRKIKNQGSIQCNRQPAFPYTLVQNGDVITLSWPLTSPLEAVSGDIAIIYEDEDLLILNKPAGLLVHPTALDRTVSLANFVMHYYQKTGQACQFHPIHRLDRNTSGLLAIAKQPRIQHLLAVKQLQDLHRNYLAIVSGHLEEPCGIINQPIARKPGSIIERIVSPDGQPAETHYETQKVYANASQLKLTLQTGRTHQIRVHMSSIGHPLLGDDLYGGATDLLERQALHACQLSLIHPLTHKHYCWEAPLPDDLLALDRYLTMQS